MNHCVVCGKRRQGTFGHPWSTEKEPLCLRCWRWGLLWCVGQVIAADRQATRPYDP